MTEQEAKAFAARVQGLWNCETTLEALLAWLFQSDILLFGFAVTSRILFSYQSLSGRVRYRLVLINSNEEAERRLEFATLVHQYDWDTERAFIFDEAEGDTREIEEFFLQHVPLFRRNCWLSGADIEVSAHEKAEWMQGLTPEEVQAWNLKF